VGFGLIYKLIPLLSISSQLLPILHLVKKELVWGNASIKITTKYYTLYTEGPTQIISLMPVQVQTQFCILCYAVIDEFRILNPYFWNTLLCKLLLKIAANEGKA
jgi:hypothetical protein